VRWAAYGGGVLAVVLGLASLGQYLSTLCHGILWFSKDFLNSLGPEVGGTGVDAFLVGGLATLIAGAFIRTQAQAEFKRSLDQLRAAGRTQSLFEVTRRWPRGLDLSGFDFTSEAVTDRELARLSFARPLILNGAARLSTLSRLSFDNCVLEGIVFGGDAGGSTLSGVVFKNCVLRGCNFTKVVATDCSKFFEGAKVRRCRFDGASFKDASLKDGDVKGSTFWGVTLVDSSLPQGVHDDLDALGAIVSLPHQGGRQVVGLRAFLGTPSWSKAGYLFKIYVFGR
jgi:hypothetical protein